MRTRLKFLRAKSEFDKQLLLKHYPDKLRSFPRRKGITPRKKEVCQPTTDWPSDISIVESRGIMVIAKASSRTTAHNYGFFTKQTRSDFEILPMVNGKEDSNVEETAICGIHLCPCEFNK